MLLSGCPLTCERSFFMPNFMLTADGGLTGAGYAVCIAAMLLFFFAAVFFAGKRHGPKGSVPISVQKLTFCGMGIALAFVASYIRLFHFPYGGAVTLFSMLFIVLLANWYGPKTGLLVGFAYGLLQFLQEPFVLSPLQVCCDYLFAFTALGLAGLFSGKKHGLVKGYILAVLMRGFFHALGGYLFWMDPFRQNFHPH